MTTACVDLADSVGPHVPWSPEWLRFRFLCYEAASDPRLPAAKADLQRFWRSEPSGFALEASRPSPSPSVAPSVGLDQGSRAGP
jgi:hypothetical protein